MGPGPGRPGPTELPNWAPGWDGAAGGGSGSAVSSPFRLSGKPGGPLSGKPGYPVEILPRPADPRSEGFGGAPARRWRVGRRQSRRRMAPGRAEVPSRPRRNGHRRPRPNETIPISANLPRIALGVGRDDPVPRAPGSDGSSARPWRSLEGLHKSRKAQVSAAARPGTWPPRALRRDATSPRGPRGRGLVAINKGLWILPAARLSPRSRRAHRSCTTGTVHRLARGIRDAGDAVAICHCRTDAAKSARRGYNWSVHVAKLVRAVPL
jgi:hypothetical protein